ncbi:MAG TPA: D-glucuronyl C5-epimerase family protein [Candidatus Cloacimonadota bacterium]|nr:D-glucuronyl C5-epimerase family protein [Candidatus Cloacimonadota bacterium]
MRLRFFVLAIMATLLLVACEDRPSQTPEARDHGFGLIKVELEDLFWNRDYLYDDISHPDCDSDGVFLFAYEGQYYYHPVAIGYLVQKALSDYLLSNDPKYLDYAGKSVNALAERATRSNGGMYFPYNYDYPIYGGEIVYRAPWYSGMAQGVLLSCFSRLYYCTGDPKYEAWADSTFATFSDFKNDISTVYVTHNDLLSLGDGYYWVEEYPNPVRRFVLNGSIMGSFGLYDYWWVFGDLEAKRLFSMEMTSVLDHFPLYRNPGDISYYCLKFKRKDAYYHQVHQWLLEQCCVYTGDTRFWVMSGILGADYH